MQNAQGMPQIESKNLGLIQDQMHHEALAVKKIQTYASQIAEPQLKQFADDLVQHHRAHFNSLFQYLNTHN